MQQKALFILILCGLLGLSLPLCAADLAITFPDKSPRAVWTGRDYPDYLPQVTDTDEATFRVTLPNDTAGLLVFVWDKATGNMATRNVDQLRGQWEVKQEEFTRVFRTVIRVESQGKLVASAMVRLSSLSKDTSKLLSPGDKGVVDFFALPSGSIKVSAEYKTQGTSKVSPLQTFELPLKRTVPEPSYTININDVVDLAEVPSPMNQEKGTTPTESDNKGDPAAKDTGSATRRDSTPNILGSILVFIFVAAAVLVGIWALLRVLQRNPKVIEDNLAKIGVQVPSVDPADDGAIPIATPMPQGPHKIVLDGADPTPATSSVSGASAAAHNPRLQTSTGTLIQLPEGTNLVTREPGSILSFPGESSISRRHAEITVQSGQARVVDLGSTNGTFVNGKKLTGEQILMPGDSVQFGSLVLRYET